MNPMSEVDLNYAQSCNCDSQCPVDLKCGEPGQVVLPGSLVGTTATVATITIDTSKFCNPCTKLEFTSNLIGIGFSGTLIFQLFKFCDNQQPLPIGGPFSFTVATPSLIARTFTFFVCDCDSCLNECCTYAVIVTVGEGTEGAITGNIGVFAARLSSVTVDNPKQDC
ncbi:DUF4489 domain-containing protein [Clostridium sp. UBA7503]|uniref:DUF4489 domain-containing protein n=1 Tax=Clostridium sp. UBA7503 TaxID=1946377 RepID=UPI0032174303